MPEHRITVLLVDDHVLVRRGFRRMLEDDPEIEVVGEAGDGSEALEQASRLKPRGVVMDFALPSMNGAMATRLIRKAQPNVEVLDPRLSKLPKDDGAPRDSNATTRGPTDAIRLDSAHSRHPPRRRWVRSNSLHPA
jgi:chemotaxis response regulator CheB